MRATKKPPGITRIGKCVFYDLQTTPQAPTRTCCVTEESSWLRNESLNHFLSKKGPRAQTSEPACPGSSPSSATTLLCDLWQVT